MRRLFPIVIALSAAAPLAHAQSDADVYEQGIAQAARLCPGHSQARTSPGIRGIGVGALRVLQQRSYALCPDRRLEGAAAVAWYPQHGVFAWNPDSATSVKALATTVDLLTRSEEFPTEITAWDAAGKPLQAQTVPAFEPRPDPRRR